MKMLRNLVLAAAALAGVLSASPSFAAQQFLCAPDAISTATGGRRVVNPNTNAAYALNSAGCTAIQQADIGYFLTQGFTPGASEGTILFTTGVATGTTDFIIGTLPAKAVITDVVFSNSVAAAVTGGVSIGTTANGTNIVAAQAVGASTDVAVVSSSILLPVPLTTGLAAPLHAAAVTAWNSANVTITVKYQLY